MGEGRGAAGSDHDPRGDFMAFIAAAPDGTLVPVESVRQFVLGSGAGRVAPDDGRAAAQARTAFIDIFVTLELDHRIAEGTIPRLLDRSLRLTERKIRAALDELPQESLIVEGFYRSPNDVPVFPARLNGREFADIHALDEAATTLLRGSSVDGVLRDALGRDFTVVLMARCNSVEPVE